MAVDVHETPGPPDDAPHVHSGHSGTDTDNSLGGGVASGPQSPQAHDILLQQLDETISALIASVEHEQLLALDDDQLLDVLHGVERCRNRFGQIDQHVVHAVDTAELPHRLQYRTVGKMLHAVLRIPWSEANARVRASRDLRAGHTITGQPLAPTYPDLAAAVATGEVAPAQADQAVRCLDRVRRLPWVTPEDVAIADHELAGTITGFDPTEFRAITQRILDHLHPDGTLADDQTQQAARRIDLFPRRDGSWHIEGTLTGLLAQKIATVLGPLTQPQDGVDGADLRSHSQRVHDALESVFDRLLRRSDNPDSGGTPMTIVVTIDYDSLVNDTGHGRLPDGSPIAPRTLLRKAAQADIIPVVLDAGGAVLDVGRTRRVATLDQTRALIARDQGCSFPSCDRPPDWCERHHILSWLDGGETNLSNLTLLCEYHHHNFEQAGWTCRMINGLPWWTPPRWIDKTQKPMINSRIRPPDLGDTT